MNTAILWPNGPKAYSEGLAAKRAYPGTRILSGLPQRGCLNNLPTINELRIQFRRAQVSLMK